MGGDHETSFRAMGCDVRILVGRGRPGSAAPAEAGAAQRAFVEDLDARLSRFRAGSELSRLNRDPREEVPASPLLCAAVGAGLWAARTTGGLLDPTLVEQLERAGYAASREGAARAPLRTALRCAPPRRPAAPRPGARWREVEVEHVAGLVKRPPGVRIDTGGTGKGLAADAVARRLARLDRFARFAVDCGGDIAVGGAGALERPYEIGVRHPFTGEAAHTLAITRGGVATSGIDARIWRRDDGRFAHHLLDPSTGEPAWTGLVCVTAVASSALEAETASKQALLSGPEGARRLLAQRGGVLVHDDGEVEVVGR
ncbi:MAG: FAD:protein FMN transferase [Thermoleophilaceae bacterium]